MSPKLLKFASDSATTSGGARGIWDALEWWPAQQIVGYGTDVPQKVTHYVAARGFADPHLLGGVIFEFQESSRPIGLNVNLLVDSSGSLTMMTAFKDQVTYLFHVADRPEFQRISIADLLVAQGPPRETWTIPTWSLLPAMDLGIDKGIADLAAAVEDIRGGILPKRPASTLRLAQRVADRISEAREADIEGWAGRLAGDVMPMTDACIRQTVRKSGSTSTTLDAAS
jgi:hypothetical protein